MDGILHQHNVIYFKIIVKIIDKNKMAKVINMFVYFLRQQATYMIRTCLLKWSLRSQILYHYKLQIIFWNTTIDLFTLIVFGFDYRGPHNKKIS